MPLTRGTLLGYDTASMTFGFTMADERGRTIQCEISGAAMDELDHRPKGRSKLPKDRRAQFETFRDQIEALASRLFDDDRSGRDTVRIFYHHVWSRPYRTPNGAATPAQHISIAEAGQFDPLDANPARNRR
jgi:Protein of unknown function (DUF1488)